MQHIRTHNFILLTSFRGSSKDDGNEGQNQYSNLGWGAWKLDRTQTKHGQR